MNTRYDIILWTLCDLLLFSKYPQHSIHLLISLFKISATIGTSDSPIFLYPSGEKCRPSGDQNPLLLSNSWIGKGAKNIDSLENLEKNSIDFYASVKSLYIQDRQQKISNRNGALEIIYDGDWEEVESQ